MDRLLRRDLPQPSPKPEPPPSDETQDRRELLPNTCCSIEPGIYLPEFGIRSEVNLVIHEHDAEVTGVPAQEEITALL